ncbi:MAG: hypothetical protein ABIN67_08260 [Ferruginibacter sp.]
MMKLNFLSQLTFRSNPEYQLVESGNLNRPEQEALAGLLHDAEVFGIFKPSPPNNDASYKLAYKEVALLFYSLQQPGKLPLYMRNSFDDDINNTLAKLVMEGIMQISSGEHFVSGTKAQDILYERKSVVSNNIATGIAQQSASAIQYALHLNELDSRSLGIRLYCYNTAPLIPESSNAFSSTEEVENFLGVGKNDPFAWEILKHWDKHAPTEKYKWIAWNRKKNTKPHPTQHSIFKIYISPVLSSFPDVFVKSVRVLTRSKAFSFKTGTDRHGLLRPDKFVVYFYSFDDLIEASDMLKDALKDYEAQGVPFTAQLDDKGMISWGIDPAEKEVLENFEGGSWRAGVTEKLGAAVVQAKADGLTKDKAMEYILNKISLEGIDPFNWIPIQKTKVAKNFLQTT